jgi:hypothetical protein
VLRPEAAAAAVAAAAGTKRVGRQPLPARGTRLQTLRYVTHCVAQTISDYK